MARGGPAPPHADAAQDANFSRHFVGIAKAAKPTGQRPFIRVSPESGIDMEDRGHHPKGSMTNRTHPISLARAPGAALSAAVYYYYGTARAGPI
jgi:hypothetical protein